MSVFTEGDAVVLEFLLCNTGIEVARGWDLKIFKTKRMKSGMHI